MIDNGEPYSLTEEQLNRRIEADHFARTIRQEYGHYYPGNHNIYNEDEEKPFTY